MAAVLPVLLAVGLGLCTVPGLAGLAGTGGSAAAPGSLSSIPGPMLALYQSASATCPGLPWTVLAAVGAVESDHGRSALPGVHSGANEAGAEGPMQFEPSTFAAYSRPIPPGGADPPSPYDPTDAVYAAARMLCADGGANPARLAGALWDYNHSGAYVAEVETLARLYVTGDGSLGTAVAAYARSQIGVAYEWGAESPGSAFDCSGLAQWAWAGVGVALPRSAQDQFDAGPQVGLSQLVPGDLVFFGSSAKDVTHVGIDIDNGLMIDAPHAGAAVRVDEIAGFTPAPVGASDPGAGR